MTGTRLSPSFALVKSSVMLTFTTLQNVEFPKAPFISLLLLRRHLVMADLRSRCEHYIFIVWFLLLSSSFFLFSSPNLSGRRVDVYHTSTHGVALVRI